MSARIDFRVHMNSFAGLVRRKFSNTKSATTTLKLRFPYSDYAAEYANFLVCYLEEIDQT